MAGSEEPLCSGGPVVKQPCWGSEAWAGYSKSNQFFLRVAIVHRPLTPLHPLQQPDPPPTQPESLASAPGRLEGQSFNEGAGGGIQALEGPGPSCTLEPVWQAGKHPCPGIQSTLQQRVVWKYGKRGQNGGWLSSRRNKVRGRKEPTNKHPSQVSREGAPCPTPPPHWTLPINGFLSHLPGSGPAYKKQNKPPK